MGVRFSPKACIFLKKRIFYCTFEIAVEYLEFIGFEGNANNQRGEASECIYSKTKTVRSYINLGAYIFLYPLSNKYFFIKTLQRWFGR